MSVLETKVISLDHHHYHGWPTLMRRRNGQLMLVYSGGREEHICPFGRVEMMVSNDDGQTWGWPRVVFDSDIDDRDAGVLETEAGTLLINTASTLSYDTLYLQAAL
ncbi:MAG: sialidase family protein, partial [Prosthecobacter sp.]|nr:sialidase family protein [Prosthecobacter sp.]